VLGKIVAGDVPSARLERKSVPENVDAAIRKALEKVPADRFTSARDFAAALADEGFRHGPAAVGAVRRAPAGPWRGLTVAFASLAAVFAALAAWALLRPEPPLAVGRFEVPLPQNLELKTIPGAAVALSSDGSEIVFAGVLGGVSQLWRRPLGALTATAIPGTEGAQTPAYSPDGTSVAFISGGRLMTVSLTGGPPLTLVDGGVANGASGLAWGDDGWLYFRPADEGALGRVSEHEGGAWETVTSASGEDLYPDAIPGGRGLLFTRAGPGGDSKIVLLDLASGEEQELFSGATARYATSGHIVYTSRAGALMAAPFDADRLEVTGPAGALVNGVETNATAGSQFALSRTGTLVYVEGAVNEGLALAEIDLQGHPRILPLAPRDYGTGPTWSADGKSVAFSSAQQIYTYDVALNTAPRQITFEGENSGPVYSPDGRRIAFSSVREGTRGSDLFIKDLGRDTRPRAILAMEGDQRATQWPGDTLLVFQSRGEDGAGDLWALDVSDVEQPEAKPYLTSVADLDYLAVSPDGTLAAYTSDESGRDEVYLRSFPDPGEPTVVSPGGGRLPMWAPDGKTLYYAKSVGRSFFAARIRRDPLPSVTSIDTLFAEPGLGVIPAPGALHPAGDRFVFAVYADGSSPDASASEPGRLILVQNFFAELKARVPD
jgi:serine/threonine-protein kinase